MWKALLLLGGISEAVAGHFLIKSDPICRQESFLVYWKALNTSVTKGATIFDISNDCSFAFQTWFAFVFVSFLLVWMFQFVPIVINFIEGPERRIKCCGEINN